MPNYRQLAAIMFTDIVGYTSLMGEDEQKAFELLRRNRQLQQPLIEQYNGKWIKEIGDAVLASFSTVTDAVLCAQSIQKASDKIPDLMLRIGIHQGEVIFEEADVFGDGVNIASRIQTIAPIGGIWISESVYSNIANKKDIKTKFVCSEVLKNVKDPVRIYEVICNNVEKEELAASRKTRDKSIAVLPFVDMSSTHDQEYLGDGLAEEILNALVHLKDLKVAGRTSSFQFKGKNIDLREVGKKLGVSTVLEGSVRKHGNRLRVTAQLINVEDGFHIWSEKYDQEMDDIFAIEDEIALAITKQLKVILLDSEVEKIRKTATHNAEAFELYLKGRFHINRRGSSIITGLNYFKEAIFFDPDYALAHAGFADANIMSATYNFFGGTEVMKAAKNAADTALRLNPTLGEAYSTLGYYNVCLEWNWPETKKNYYKAMELSPKLVQGRSLYALLYLTFVEGNFPEAEKQTQFSIRLEPLSAIDHADLAWILYTANRFEEALKYAQTGIELDNNSFLSHRLAGLCYSALQRHKEAIDRLQYLMTISNRHQHALNALIWAYCSNGNYEDARALMNELKGRSATEYVGGSFAGISAGYLGDIDVAFQYLENAYNDRDPMILTLKYSPYVPRILREDPRLQSLLEKVGFPDDNKFSIT